MVYKTTYSSDLSSQEIYSIFLGAKYRHYIHCDWCRSDRAYKTDSMVWRCRSCWKYFSLTSRTYLENTRLDLRYWYEVTWHFVIMHSAHQASKLLKDKDHRKVLSCYQIIRQALLDYSEYTWSGNLEAGTYEVDESYFGGEFKNLRKEVRERLRQEGKAKRGRGAKYRKQPVFGVYRRNGEVYLKPIPSCDAEILIPIIEGMIPKESIVNSDTFRPYNGLEALGYVHFTIDHHNQEYVNGKIHINGLEGFWGLAKTNMHTYKGVRKKNWIYYLKEMEFRYNNRDLEYEERAEKIIHILMGNFD